MRLPAIAVLAAAFLCLAPSASRADLVPYSQDFEGLVQSDPNALANDGWWVYGNVYDADSTWIRGYGSYPAPNHALAFCAIAVGEGGVEQGDQQLSVFSDYENTDHALGYLIESNVFHEQPIGAADVGNTWIFEFQAKLGNLEGTSSALAFIKTIDPNSGYDMTNFVTVDMTSIPTTWGGYSVSLPIISELVGQLLQFGFANTTTAYQGSGVFYDNVVFRNGGATAVVSPPSAFELRQNAPNPFTLSTSIAFTLSVPDDVDVSVYDVKGRRVATLVRGGLAAGLHQATWNGRTESGAALPAGIYQCVLRTSQGQVSRSMVLIDG